MLCWTSSSEERKRELQSTTIGKTRTLYHYNFTVSSDRSFLWKGYANLVVLLSVLLWKLIGLSPGYAAALLYSNFPVACRLASMPSDDP